MSELLPCPFCGGSAKLHHSEPGIEDRIWSIVICKNLECPGSTLKTWYVNDDDAIRIWNTRHERTCHMIFDYEEMCFRCDACGSTFGTENSKYGKEWWGRGEYVYGSNYCSECGAKVVDG